MVSDSMTSRERITAAINHETPDRLPCNDSPWTDTEELWHEQGMPPDMTSVDYFKFDICHMALDCSPRFEQKIISIDDNGYYTYQDRYGYTATKPYKRDGSSHFYDLATTDQDAWERNKHRWSLSDDPNEPARIDDAHVFQHFDPYPSWDQAKQKYDNIYAKNRYMLVSNYGPWEATWRHRGYTELLMDVALEPDWLAEMALTHTQLSIAVLQKCLNIGIKPDGYFIVEDLAQNTGPLFSPNAWRKIFRPCMEVVGQFLYTNNIDFWMHCCGQPEVYFDDVIECGVKVINPLQASTGLHVLELKKKYGKRVAWYGNISAAKMSGPQDELEQEIRSKIIPPTGGGYVFHSDHSVPPKVSFERYQWIMKTVRQCAGEYQKATS